MITRRHRFHGHSILPQLYRRAKTARGQMIGLKYLPRTEGQPYRLAVVVSRKVHKHAVVRNKIRRRIYEIVRQRASDFSRPYDLVLTVYDEKLATLPTEQLEQQIVDVCLKAGVLTTGSEHGIVN